MNKKQKRRLKRIYRALIRKPFKSSQSYEWQIGPLVISLMYPHSNMQPEREHWALKFWHDTRWAR